MTNSIEFLTLVEIIEIHTNQIHLYGGDDGIRDLSLLSSAIAIPQSTFDGSYLHNDLFDMASAYIFHICQNHPFVDGNKRVALVSGLIFLAQWLSALWYFLVSNLPSCQSELATYFGSNPCSQ